MQVLEKRNQQGEISITMVCGVHGEEVFSHEVFLHFVSKIDAFPGLKIVLANEEAIEKQERYIDEDLNRSFAAKECHTHEQKLAQELLKEIQEGEYVLDIHTTISELTMVPIITSLNEATKQVINLTTSEQVVFVESPLADKSMIGQIPNGVSLEYNVAYAKELNRLKELEELILGLLQNNQVEQQIRELYTVTGTIPKTIQMPEYANNFVYVEELGVYPFLYAKDSYKYIHGLAATKKESISI